MIRHAIRLADLKAQIRKASPKWFRDARAVLQGLPARPRSSDFDPIWSRIKDVYIRLQCSKCCYCERPLEGGIEQDVEHFRPKAEVRPWTPPARLQAAGVPLTPPAAAGPVPGYAGLAYHPFNYAVACKFCNSILKQNYFPIAGRRRSRGRDPAKMKGERAYLVYPLGDVDDDPEQLIEFDGLAPRPRQANGFAHQRALVVIELFKLDDADERPILFAERAVFIRLLFRELEHLRMAGGTPGAAPYQVAVDVLTGDGTPFANCLRSFLRLYQADRARAQQYAEACLKYVETKSIRRALE